MLVRSPTLTNGMSSVSANGSSPESSRRGVRVGTTRGVSPTTASAIAPMCGGVVPQHPPTMLTRPASANSLRNPAVVVGCLVVVAEFVRAVPAFGYTHSNVSATAEISSMWGRISSAPSAQFKPTVSGWAWRIECQNAVGVWPDSVRPERSVIVPEIISGRFVPARASERRAATIAAFGVERVEDRLDEQQRRRRPR